MATGSQAPQEVEGHRAELLVAFGQHQSKRNHKPTCRWANFSWRRGSTTATGCRAPRCKMILDRWLAGWAAWFRIELTTGPSSVATRMGYSKVNTTTMGPRKVLGENSTPLAPDHSSFPADFCPSCHLLCSRAIAPAEGLANPDHHPVPSRETEACRRSWPKPHHKKSSVPTDRAGMLPP